MTERSVLRLIIGYQEAWFAHFPLLSRRAEWHILNHLAIKARGGAPAGELYGLVKQVFLLDDATVKERLMSISQAGLCDLDPPGQVFARTVATPTSSFLIRYDTHLADFARIIADVAGNPAIAAPAEISALWRTQIMRPLDAYQEYWQVAADAIFEHSALSPARRSDARRHLISPSHWNLVHTAFRWHYDSAPDSPPVLADRLAARLLDLTGQTVQTTKDHIGYLIEMGIFRRMPGRSLHVAPSEVALHYVGWALQQTANALPPLFAALGVAAPPASPAAGQSVAPGPDDEDSERTLNIKPETERHVLEVLAPTEFAQRFAVHPPFTIGRAAPSEVVLARSDVSRTHCRIASDADGLVVADLNSTNGTFLNDRRITQPTPLKPGDRLRVGSFVLRYDTDASATESTQRAPAPDSVHPSDQDVNKRGNSGI
jgi:hypothetical protein